MERADFTPSVKRLIINADDLGLSPGVTTGIFQAAEAGTVTAASMITNLEGFDDAVARAPFPPNISVGVHLNLTTGRALTPAKSLTRARTGEFFGAAPLLLQATMGRIDPADVEEECGAQIDRLTAAGIVPSHVDSHRHVHAHPVLLAPAVRAARARGVKLIRRPVERITLRTGEIGPYLKSSALAASWRIAARGADFGSTDHFFGLSLQGSASFETRLIYLLRSLPAGTSELMVHPGHVDAALRLHDGYLWERERELRALLSTRVKAAIAGSSVQLVSFGALLLQ
ncbi:MAG: carbohydrate deacetylase [Gemmatimonadaceae bacterium]